MSATPAARLRTALELFELGEQLMRTRLAREHQEWKDDELDAAVQRWLHDRPGAPIGDHPGPRSTRVIGSPPQ